MYIQKILTLQVLQRFKKDIYNEQKTGNQDTLLQICSCESYRDTMVVRKSYK